MKVLLLSAYDAPSHKRWRQGLVDHFPDVEWTVLTLPPRYFSWRIRGNSLSWAFDQATRSQLEGHYDLLIATSMVDLSALRGFVPQLASLPTLVYVHENQFAYPKSQQSFSSIEPKILNLYTALCADALVFNSEFNRRTFFEGAQASLKKMPDRVPAGVLQTLESRTQVLPVPLEAYCFEPPIYTNSKVNWQASEGDIKLLWAARWEYDKAPDRLLAVLRVLRERQQPFKLALLGQQFRNTPAEFSTIEQEFAEQLVHFGFAESADVYRQWLTSADMVLSTAIHEFQGLAVLEAIAAGGVPVLPDRQAYSELVDNTYLYSSVMDDIEAEAQSMADCIQRLSSERLRNPNIEHLSWRVMAPKYRKLMEALVDYRG